MQTAVNRRGRYLLGASALAALIAMLGAYALFSRGDAAPRIEGTYFTEGGLGLVAIQRKGRGKLTIESKDFTADPAWPQADGRRARNSFNIEFMPGRKTHEASVNFVLGRMDFESSSSTDGSWDLLRATNALTDRVPYKEWYQFNRMNGRGFVYSHFSAARDYVSAAREHRGEKPRHGLVLEKRMPDFLVRFDDPRAESYHRTQRVENNPGLAFQISESLLLAHPENLGVRAIALEAALKGRDAELLRERLQGWRADFEASRDGWLKRIPGIADEAIRSLESELNGKNYRARLDTWKSQPMDLQGMFQEASRILDFDECLAPATELDLRQVQPNSVINFLEIQIFSKVLRTWAIFDLMEGAREEAAVKLAGALHLGFLLCASEHLINRLIGIAVSAIASRGMLIYVANACETGTDLERLRPRLTHIAQELEKVEGNPFHALLDPAEAAFWNTDTETAPEHNQREATARANVRLLLASAEAKYLFVTEGRFPEAEKDFGALLGRGLENDPFGEGGLKFRPEADQITLWSVGPDKKNDAAAITYDPTNGTASRGDIAVRIPKQREFPFPREGVRASTIAEVQAIFPNGLPADIFAKTSGKWLGLTEDSEGVYVYSYGPDVDEREARSGSGMTFLDPLYDPTNGTTSNGDLWVKLKKP